MSLFGSPQLERLLLELDPRAKSPESGSQKSPANTESRMKWVREEETDMGDLSAANAGAIEVMIEGTREHFRQGASGFIRDGQIVLEPWGFELEDVEAETMLWYGTADINVPVVRIGREMAKRLKTVELKEYEGETQLTTFGHRGEEILGDVLKD